MKQLNFDITNLSKLRNTICLNVTLYNLMFSAVDHKRIQFKFILICDS